MASFENALLHHRKSLAQYMEEWNQQQEFLFARYADSQCRQTGSSHALMRGGVLDTNLDRLQSLDEPEHTFETKGCLGSAFCARSAAARLAPESKSLANKHPEVILYPHAEQAASEVSPFDRAEDTLHPHAEEASLDHLKLCSEVRRNSGEGVTDQAGAKRSSEDSRMTDTSQGCVTSPLLPATSTIAGKHSCEEAGAGDGDRNSVSVGPCCAQRLANGRLVAEDPPRTLIQQGSVTSAVSSAVVAGDASARRPVPPLDLAAVGTAYGRQTSEDCCTPNSDQGHASKFPALGASTATRAHQNDMEWSSTVANLCSERPRRSPKAIMSSPSRSWRESVAAMTRPSFHVPLSMDGIRTQLSFEERPKLKRTRKVTQSGYLTRIVESTGFTVLFAIVIVANTVFMAVAADHMLESARKGTSPNVNVFFLVDAMFTIFYVIELVLKLGAYGTHFFIGNEWKSNTFDFIVVVSAIVDLIAPFFMGSTVDMSYLRVNRMVKLAKMMRIVKVYLMFKELRVIIASLVGCAKIMFWAISLISIVLFMFALFFCQGVTEYLSVHPRGETNRDFIVYWGSLSTTMTSLFQSTTGGLDWTDAAKPLLDLGWVYYLAFMIYVCFFMFFVVNVLTGLFVDAALHASVKDDSQMIREEMKNKQEYVRQIKTLFHRLDDNCLGELSWEAFQKGMNSPDMLTFASALDIEIADVDEFFKILSAGGNEVVDIEKFVVGCMKLKGSARSVDVVSLLYRYKTLEQYLQKFCERTDQRLVEQQELVEIFCQVKQGCSLDCPSVSATLHKRCLWTE